jgi:LEA14-like dessication related protein
LGQKIVALQDINASSLKIPVKQIHSNVLLVNIETTKGTITKKIVVE